MSTKESKPEIMINKRWVLAEHPPETGFVAAQHAKLIEEPIDLETRTLEKSQLLIQVEAMSVDAFIRTILDEKSYHGSIKPGSAMVGVGYGTIVKAGPESKLKVGTRVSGIMAAATIAFRPDANGLQPVSALPAMKLSYSLSLFGVGGLSAYFGIFHAPKSCPKKGDTVVVSAAAGGVGSIAVQIAKLTGAKVIGIAGGSKKCKFLLDELGLDGAINYKDESKSLSQQLDESCPDGIDFFFDNVGGELLDLVLERINVGAQIVICGAVSQYDSGNVNKKGSVYGPSNYLKLAENSASMTGFSLMHYLSSMSNVFKCIAYLWWNKYLGKIKIHQHVLNGVESFPTGIEMLFKGDQCGRIVINVDGKLET